MVNAHADALQNWRRSLWCRRGCDGWRGGGWRGGGWRGGGRGGDSRRGRGRGRRCAAQERDHHIVEVEISQPAVVGRHKAEGKVGGQIGRRNGVSACGGRVLSRQVVDGLIRDAVAGELYAGVAGGTFEAGIIKGEGRAAGAAEIRLARTDSVDTIAIDA